MTNQFQISKIENGWLVATPPSAKMIQSAQQQGQQPQGEVFYCNDYFSLCQKLGTLMGESKKISVV